MSNHPTTLADPAAAAQALAQGAEAIGQRLITVPAGTELTDCECGLLLAPLPTPVTITRTYAFGPRPTTREHRITHAHVARPDDANPACHACYDDPAQGTEHGAHMCDTPEPRPCTTCYDPVLPGHSTCPNHTNDEAEWDKDTYLALG